MSLKTMVITLFCSLGPVLLHAVEKQSIADIIYFIENCLSPAFELKSQRASPGLRGIKLFHDNAKSLSRIFY